MERENGPQLFYIPGLLKILILESVYVDRSSGMIQLMDLRSYEISPIELMFKNQIEIHTSLVYKQN